MSRLRSTKKHSLGKRLRLTSAAGQFHVPAAAIAWTALPVLISPAFLRRITGALRRTGYRFPLEEGRTPDISERPMSHFQKLTARRTAGTVGAVKSYAHRKSGFQNACGKLRSLLLTADCVELKRALPGTVCLGSALFSFPFRDNCQFPHKAC